MKKHCITFEQITNIEDLTEGGSPCYDALVRYRGMVLAAMLNWKGRYEAAVYEFIETPEETGLGEIECRLNLVGISDETYEDSGSAIEWAMDEVRRPA